MRATEQETKTPVSTSFFGDMLQTIAERGRALIDRTRDRREAAQQRSATLIQLCDQLLSGRGEASGVALAGEILARYGELKTGSRIAFFETLASRYGPDHERLEAAVAKWRETSTDDAAAEVHRASEPRRLELLRRLNLAPGGTASLVRMREQLLDAIVHRDDLGIVDNDFVHLFSSWFNRGFLVLRRIDWSTPANVLEKIIRYEAVHAIRDWDDLRARIDSLDRRCYAFFHPALNDDPLIFVEVALTRGIPAAIEPILSDDRQELELGRVNTAVFYSISNCQRGLSGVSFGSFLIKQVVEEISREMPKLSTFVTLSPAPNFAAWLNRERASEAPRGLSEEDRAVLTGTRPARLVARSRGRRRNARSAAARRRLLLPARAQPPQRPARFGGALPPRQRRPARAAQFPCRHLRASAAPVLWPDGELSLRPRRDREEPRGLRAASGRRRRQCGDTARSRSRPRRRPGGRLTPPPPHGAGQGASSSVCTPRSGAKSAK